MYIVCFPPHKAFTGGLRKYLQYYRACVLSTPPTLSLLTISFLFRKVGRQLRWDSVSLLLPYCLVLISHPFFLQPWPFTVPHGVSVPAEKKPWCWCHSIKKKEELKPLFISRYLSELCCVDGPLGAGQAVFPVVSPLLSAMPQCVSHQGCARRLSDGGLRCRWLTAVRLSSGC